jgi:hypothetical protein
MPSGGVSAAVLVARALVEPLRRLVLAGAVLCMLAGIELALQLCRAILVVKQLAVSHAVAPPQLRLAHRLGAVVLRGSRGMLPVQRGFALAVPPQLTPTKPLAPAQLGLGQRPWRFDLMRPSVTRSFRMSSRRAHVVAARVRVANT